MSAKGQNLPLLDAFQYVCFIREQGYVLRVMKSGKTYEIAGPYHGSLDDYTKRCSWWQSMLGTCSKQPVEDVGATPGATRGLVRPGGTSPREH